MLGTAEADQWLQDNFTDRVLWMALHSSSPGAAGDPATEIAGSGYERQRAIFGTPSAKTVLTTNNQIFAGMPACTITDIAIWSGQFTGRMVHVIHLGAPDAVTAGQQYLGAAGDYAVSLD